jgi:hypothetical protein
MTTILSVDKSKNDKRGKSSDDQKDKSRSIRIH